MGKKATDHNAYIPRKRLYNLKEVAEYLGRPLYSVRMLIYERLLPIVKDKPDSRKMYVDFYDLQRFVEDRKSTL